MNDSLGDLDDILSEIPEVKADTESLARLSDNDDFMRLSVELVKEVGSLTALIAGIVPVNGGKWSRDEAIVMGNVVRLSKLISGLHDQVCQKRQETAWVFSRLIFECLVNIKFLAKNASPELFESYVAHSLRHEKKLHTLILSNIKQRGSQFPIETRMLSSIERYMKISGVSIENLSPSQPKEWGGKNLYERAVDVGLGEVYLGTYGGASRSIHGGWTDLLGHHISHTDDGFMPDFDWDTPRPQQLLPMSRLITETAHDYLDFIKCPPEALVRSRLKGLGQRLGLADQAHENHLILRMQDSGV